MTDEEIERVARAIRNDIAMSLTDHERAAINFQAWHFRSSAIAALVTLSPGDRLTLGGVECQVVPVDAAEGLDLEAMAHECVAAICDDIDSFGEPEDIVNAGTFTLDGLRKHFECAIEQGAERAMLQAISRAPTDAR